MRKKHPYGPPRLQGRISPTFSWQFRCLSLLPYLLTGKTAKHYYYGQEFCCILFIHSLYIVLPFTSTSSLFCTAWYLDYLFIYFNSKSPVFYMHFVLGTMLPYVWLILFCFSSKSPNLSHAYSTQYVTVCAAHLFLILTLKAQAFTYIYTPRVADPLAGGAD